MRRKSAAHHAVKVAVPGGRCLVNDAAVNGEACTLVAADGTFVLSKYRFLKDVIKNRQILSDLAVILSRQPNVWSEWRESNSRPLEPHLADALSQQNRFVLTGAEMCQMFNVQT